jgi:hypothetical protein
VTTGEYGLVSTLTMVLLTGEAEVRPSHVLYVRLMGVGMGSGGWAW